MINKTSDLDSDLDAVQTDPKPKPRPAPQPVNGGYSSMQMFDELPKISANRTIDVNLTPNSFGYKPLVDNDYGLLPYEGQENVRAYNQSIGE